MAGNPANPLSPGYNLGSPSPFTGTFPTGIVKAPSTVASKGSTLTPAQYNALVVHPGAAPKAAPTALDQLMAFVNSQGTMVGGSGGSAGNGAAINAAKAAAAARYGTQRNQLTDLYGQLRDALTPIAGQTAASYNQAINASNTAGGNIAGTAAAQAGANDTQANQAYQSLGITAPTNSLTDQAAQTGQQNLASNNANFGNLMAVLSQAQQAQDNNNATGAVDEGVNAQTALSNNYQNALAALEAQRTSGSGGTPAHYSNPYATQLANAQFSSLLSNAGLGTKAATTKASPYTAAGLAALKNATTNFEAANGGKTPTNTQLQNQLLKSNSTEGLNALFGLLSKTPIQ